MTKPIWYREGTNVTQANLICLLISSHWHFSLGQEVAFAVSSWMLRFAKAELVASHTDLQEKDRGSREGVWKQSQQIDSEYGKSETDLLCQQ